jgi:hypothetical protein
MWEEHDIWKDIWRAVLGALDEKGLLDWEETFLDATFVSAKKGATQSASLLTAMRSIRARAAAANPPA